MMGTKASEEEETQQQKMKNISISQAAQVSMDARAYAKLIPRIGKVLDHALTTMGWSTASSASSAATTSSLPPGGVSNDGSVIVAEARRAFEKTGDRAQDMIFELLREKTDELVPTHDLGANWEPGVAVDTPRPEVEDLISYLRITFMCLTYLPSSIREAVHFASCSHIQATLRADVVDRVGRINVYGLHQLRVDVAALEEFADECGVPQLRLCFTPLRQLLNASLDRNASSSAGNGVAGWAKSETLRLSLFPQLDADTLIAVLGKVHGLPMVSKMKFGQQQQRSAYDLPALDHRSASELVKQIQASTGM